MIEKNNNKELFDLFSRKFNEWDLLIELKAQLEEYGTCRMEPLEFKGENEESLILMLNGCKYWVQEEELEQVLSILKEEAGIVIAMSDKGELELFEPESAPKNLDDLPF